QLFWRGVVLFLIGTIFTFVLTLLQAQRRFSSFKDEDLMNSILCSRWWLPVICGSGSAFVGLICPFLEHKINDQHMRSQEWSHVLRCIAMFVGINEACTKIDFPSNLQLSLSLSVLSVGLWWYFDRTKVGFGIGVIVAILATFITQILVHHQVCLYSEREFLYVRSWLPCVVFSGGITIANIGKQLAMNDFAESENKSHAE
ncbi:LOW QUALITY PROTEIN: insulin-induced gene 2 protein-like, partial [Stegodyphus dumicola]|uniref:LOW QUALITY PROTEIN: insulin-induced gene 2 protein-like n=1 Tax=Stegodyphus dumicola TaxID=202533 RepID=UPI0015ABCC76